MAFVAGNEIFTGAVVDARRRVALVVLKLAQLAAVAW